MAGFHVEVDMSTRCDSRWSPDVWADDAIFMRSQTCAELVLVRWRAAQKFDDWERKGVKVRVEIGLREASTGGPSLQLFDITPLSMPYVGICLHFSCPVHVKLA